MLDTIIIDDNKKSIQLIQILLSRFCPKTITIIGEATNYLDGVNLINTKNPKLVFLDINLAENITGFNLLSNFKNPEFKIIFISGYKEHALKAFDYNALGYLLKPIDSNKLVVAVNNVVSYFKMSSTSSKPQNFLFVPSTYKIDLVDISKILYLYADGKYTQFKIEGENTLLSSQNLKIYEDKITENSFFRIHKSYIVNINKVKTIDKENGGFCIMDNGDRIPISRRKKELFLNYIGLK